MLDGADAPEDISSATCGFDMLHWSKGGAGAGDVDVDGAVGKEKGKELKRWNSAKSVGTLRLSNPEVDEYVSWGVAR